MEMRERIINVLSEQLGVNKSEISDESNLVNDLGADSLDVVEIIMALEKEFDLTIPDSEVDGIKTVGDLVKKAEKLNSSK